MPIESIKAIQPVQGPSRLLSSEIPPSQAPPGPFFKETLSLDIDQLIGVPKEVGMAVIIREPVPRAFSRTFTARENQGWSRGSERFRHKGRGRGRSPRCMMHGKRLSDSTDPCKGGLPGSNLKINSPFRMDLK